ncbi:hypothetical protein J6590_013220 [Homalodisca vitripennis]|nr:hypothetical protein J6590_013220 [Homalodisca vitripennis]
MLWISPIIFSQFGGGVEGGAPSPATRHSPRPSLPPEPSTLTDTFIKYLRVCVVVSCSTVYPGRSSDRHIGCATDLTSPKEPRLDLPIVYHLFRTSLQMIKIRPVIEANLIMSDSARVPKLDYGVTKARPWGLQSPSRILSLAEFKLEKFKFIRSIMQGATSWARELRAREAEGGVRVAPRAKGPAHCRDVKEYKLTSLHLDYPLSPFASLFQTSTAHFYRHLIVLFVSP